VRRKYRYDKYPEIREAIKRVFSRLRAANIYSRMNFSCCGNCATAELADMLDEPKYKKFIGAAFFHGQDNDNLKTNGQVYIGFFSRSDNSEDTVTIGQRIVDMLKGEDELAVVWDGSHRKRILVVKKFDKEHQIMPCEICNFDLNQIYEDAFDNRDKYKKPEDHPNVKVHGFHKWFDRENGESAGWTTVITCPKCEQENDIQDGWP
jgi:hypothetical protein